MTGSDDWQALLAAAASDNVSGAHSVTADAASVLVAYSEQASPASRDELLADLRRISCDLLSAQPAMASIANLLNAAWWSVHDDSSLKTLPGAVESHTASAREAVIAVSRAASALLAPESTVMTISASSTVAQALLLAHEEALRPRVVCLESRPMLEGQRFAAMLAENGLPVTLAVDAAAHDCVAQADLLFLGVDSLTPEGVLGKIGIAGLSLAARQAGLPVYALADRTKLWPVALGSPFIRQRPPEEVWPDPPGGVRVSNRYFDVADWANVEGVVSEDGVLTAAEARKEGQAIPVHAELAALYGEVAEELSSAFPEPRDWYLYIISCSDNTLYTGITTDLERRVAQHNAGKGAAYTASRRPVALQAAWLFPNRSAATRAERAMKRRSRPGKLKAIERGDAFKGGPPAQIEPL